jgi:hypothetical protein
MLDPSAARQLTDKIKATTTDLCRLLVEAHDRKAWKALGYKSWAQYVTVEFHLSRQHVYRMLDRALVIDEIRATAELSPAGDTDGVPSIDLTEREARDIKPHLAVVKAEIANAIVDTAEADRPAIVKRIVQKHRSGGLDAEPTGAEIAGSPIHRVVPLAGKTVDEARAEQLADRAKMGAEALGLVLNLLLARYLDTLTADKSTQLLSNLRDLQREIAAVEMAIVKKYDEAVVGAHRGRRACAG